MVGRGRGKGSCIVGVVVMVEAPRRCRVGWTIEAVE